MGARKTTDDSRFNQFWDIYPRKVDKGHAKLAFRSALTKVSFDDLIAAVQSFAASEATIDKRYVPYPGTWLRGERWADETPKAKADAATKPAGDKASQRAWYEKNNLHVPFKLRA